MWLDKNAGNGRKKAEPVDPAFVIARARDYFFFFLRTPARPIKPVPNRSMVAGSGTGAVSYLT
jgi:hypothetical protein